jgi:hypothetical protein
MFGCGGWHNPGEPLEQVRRWSAEGAPRNLARHWLVYHYGDALSPARRSEDLEALRA